MLSNMANFAFFFRFRPFRIKKKKKVVKYFFRRSDSEIVLEKVTGDALLEFIFFSISLKSRDIYTKLGMMVYLVSLYFSNEFCLVRLIIHEIMEKKRKKPDGSRWVPTGFRQKSGKTCTNFAKSTCIRVGNS